ncbi:MAG TPA: Glu/Leu/Phe/Val dehydrogenase [Actinomycetota bacterium]|nr:Glu/Leu/Phe/Val dehydrogenase [Actinomycetota bacterium]
MRRLLDQETFIEMSVFEHINGDGYEQVVFCSDDQSGLRAIIAIHSTALGPALGGTRFYPYPAEDLALVDVLRLAKGMTYKAAAAGLDLGGGKAVIIGDPRRIKTEELLRAYGRFVETLGGRYITAEDVGTALEDMDVVRRESRWVTGCSHTYGGSGDPSPVTAFGVLQGIKACALEVFGDPSLSGRTVALQGVGKVGHALCGYLVEEGAKVTIGDIDVDNLGRAVGDYGVETTSLADIHKQEVDVFAPCALGGIVNDDTISEFRCKIIAGAANNQLARPEHGDKLRDLGILYAPDFVINAGGLINVEDELRGYDRARAMKRVEGIYKQLQLIFAMANERNLSTARAAEEHALERIRKISRIRLVRTAEFGPSSTN